MVYKMIIVRYWCVDLIQVKDNGWYFDKVERARGSVDLLVLESAERPGFEPR